MSSTQNSFYTVKYTFVNAVRFVLALLIAFIALQLHHSLLSLFYWGAAFLAFAWFLAEELRLIRLDEKPRLSYIPTTFDIFLVTVFFFTTGTVNSLAVGGYIYITVVSSLNIQARQGLYSVILSPVAYLAASLIAYLGPQPVVDIFGSITIITLQNLIVSFLLFLLVLFSVYYIITTLRENNLKLYRELEIEKEKSENLLLNILPVSVSDELKEKGESRPVFIDSASVMFIDFVNFTGISQSLSPDELVCELDRYFSEFDRIIKKYGVEKLKTVGDGYMCAGGLPQPNSTHLFDVALTALAVLGFIRREKSTQEEKGAITWDVRIGIHTGPVVAGIIGTSRFSYDIWGDTVNTAVRHEQTGEPGTINISEACYASLSGFFDFEYRGKIQVKGKGDLGMYVLRGLKSNYLNTDGTPNRLFFADRDNIIHPPFL